MANTYTPQFKERALRMMDDHRRVEETSVWGAATATGEKLGISPHTLRGWSRQARRDAGVEEGPTSADLEELKRLRREVKELKRANEILKTASAFSPRNSTVPRRNDPVHRHIPGSLRGRVHLSRPGRDGTWVHHLPWLPGSEVPEARSPRPPRWSPRRGGRTTPRRELRRLRGAEDVARDAPSRMGHRPGPDSPTDAYGWRDRSRPRSEPAHHDASSDTRSASGSGHAGLQSAGAESSVGR